MGIIQIILFVLVFALTWIYFAKFFTIFRWFYVITYPIIVFAIIGTIMIPVHFRAINIGLKADQTEQLVEMFESLDDKQRKQVYFTALKLTRVKQ